MPEQNRACSPGPDSRSVRTDKGVVLPAPEDWELLPPGDPALTRRVKADGPSWTVSEKRGRRVFSRGVWAPRERIERISKDLEHERSDPAYTKKIEAGRKRRNAQQARYAVEFTEAVARFLAFSSPHVDLGDELARAIAEHATPVGSGSVARTQRIPVQERAEAATIAWLRHQTTSYDTMRVPRQKGMRRQVRRMLAEHSRELLAVYRRGEHVDPRMCLLRCGLAQGKAVKPAANSPARTAPATDHDEP